MNISMEEKKLEAVSRMKMLNVFPETIRQFEEDGYISISEPPFGAFFWCEGEELKAVREFEIQNSALVYMIVRQYTNIGKMDAYLFVSDYRDEWEMDRSMFQDRMAFAYVVNADAPEFSEFGDIGIERTIAAGLRRTW